MLSLPKRRLTSLALIAASLLPASSTATLTATSLCAPLSSSPLLSHWYNSMSTDASATAATTTGSPVAAASGAAFRSRPVGLSILSREQAEGRGARVRRSIGNSQLRNLDPFLMLDEFVILPPGGFPDHPHRGMATVTYILPGSEGTVQHEDSVGNAGEIGAGDVQWMTAGRGIVHAEMPGNGKSARGMQLWVNLLAKDKMCEPEYQELIAKDIPKGEKDGVHVAVIAGEALGIKAKIFTKTPTHYLHYTLQPGARIDHHVPAHWNGFLYTLGGSGWVGPDAAEQRPAALREPHYTLTLGKPLVAGVAPPETDGVTVVAGDKGFEFVLIAGEPLNEPTVQYGPFVMNTAPEIEKAFSDYRRGVNGFENSQTWVSKIRNKWQNGNHDDDN